MKSTSVYNANCISIWNKRSKFENTFIWKIQLFHIPNRQCVFHFEVNRKTNEIGWRSQDYGCHITLLVNFFYFSLWNIQILYEINVHSHVTVMYRTLKLPTYCRVTEKTVSPHFCSWMNKNTQFQICTKSIQNGQSCQYY